VIARAPVTTRFQRISPWISTLVRLALAGIFLAAGGLKAIDVSASVASVRAYALLPAGVEMLVGWGLPFVEIALGLLLAAGAFLRVVGAVSAVMVAGFIGAVVSAAARGLSIDCGCFGGGGTVAPGQTDYTGEIIRDVLFLLLALWLVWQPRSRLALDAGPVERWDREEAR
jgi:uncharacterized membrane protein YphA (DoxX/SURF4 family)